VPRDAPTFPPEPIPARIIAHTCLLKIPRKYPESAPKMSCFQAWDAVPFSQGLWPGHGHESPLKKVWVALSFWRKNGTAR
jgi:hypothetical protein